jgi:5-guanidino-2-oxopentanoate decarboxylase
MASNQIGGHAVVAHMEAYGVDTVFGIPGVHTLDLYRGLAERGMRHIGVRHEQGAGFMADGYARASGKPGVCCLITGPGLMNAATPIGQAYSDSVPIPVVASVNASRDLGKGRGRLHEITDQRAAISPLTGLARTLRHPVELPGAFADAFRLFEAARPRPVVLEFPLDFLAGISDARQPFRKRAERPKATDSELDAAVAMIKEARRILVILGGGTVDCPDEATALVEAAGAFCVTTTAGKGVLPDSHPQSLGATMSRQGTLAEVAAADLVIAVGTELGETDSWVDRLEINGNLIRIDLDSHTLTRDYEPSIGLLADAGPTMASLAGRLKSHAAPDLARAKEIRDKNFADTEPLQRRHMKVLDAIRAAMPPDGMVFTDMTQIAYTGNVYYPCERPRSWFHPNGFGTLGYAMPAAIGGKIARPKAPVAAIAGDAGFLFTVQDLGTAVEQRLGLPIILWNNDALGQIAGDMIALDIPELGVKPRNPDYLALAAAFGAKAERPDNLPAISDAIARALSADGPTLIEVRQDSAFLD